MAASSDHSRAGGDTRRVLIVSPHFPPINAPDHQRARMCLPYLAQWGWKATVLAVEPDGVEEGVREEFLLRSVPASCQVVRTKALPIRLTRKIGLGSLALRALPYLMKAGSALLEQKKFDLVFFSTTQFPVLALGPIWNRRYGVPYVLDFQDPWLNDYYDSTGKAPPGGRFKHGLSMFIAKFMEPRAVASASHIISVSPAYPAMLRRRYPVVEESRFSVIPFGGSEHDFSLLQNTVPSSDLCPPSSALRPPLSDLRPPIQPPDLRPPTSDRRPPIQPSVPRPPSSALWLYAGRAGDDMAFAFRVFFSAMKGAVERDGSLRDRLKVKLVGTNYAPASRTSKSVGPIAAEFGLSDMTFEEPARIGYFDVLRHLKNADALLIFGSDDPGYTASKIYPYILAKKPLLAIFHEESSVVKIIRETNAGIVVTFKNGDSVEEIAAKVKEMWFGRMPLTTPATDWNAFAPYTAEAMTKKMCEVFDAVAENKALQLQSFI